MQFYIKNYDTVLCKVEVFRGLMGETNCRVNEVYNLPLVKTLIGEDIVGWVLHRKPYLKRKNIEQLLAQSGIKCLEDYFCLTFGLSLTDTLWICPVGVNITWKSVNLYENRFNKYVANFAFTGTGEIAVSTSPEYSTNGALPKCWKRLNNRIYLYKGGSDGAVNAGREPLSEYYATQLLKAMNCMSYIPYDCKKYHNKLVSVCELFTNIDYGFTAQSQLQYYKTFEEVFFHMKKTAYWDDFRKMLILDALILNDDRHLGNYGYLRDNHTGKIVSFAPIFDNGCGCLTYYYSSSKQIVKQELESYIDAKRMSSGADFVVVAKLCLDNQMYKVLKDLRDFRFQQHPLDNRDVKVLDIMLQRQISKIVRK